MKPSDIDSTVDVEYYKHGGILNYVLRQFLKGLTAIVYSAVERSRDQRLNIGEELLSNSQE